MLRVVPFKAEHVAALQPQAAQVAEKEFVNPEQLKAFEAGFMVTAMDGDEVVAVGGVLELWPGRGVACAMLGATAKRHLVGLHKIALGVLNAAPFRRIETDVECGFTQGHRWVHMLGFSVDAPCLKAYRPDGGDSSLYSRVR